METLEVKCPGCSTILIVDKKTGQVIEQRKALIKDSTGDRFEDARLKVERSAADREAKAEAAKKAQNEKLSRLDALFQSKKKEIEESGQPIERPRGAFDDE